MEDIQLEELGGSLSHGTSPKKDKDYLLPASILIAGLMISGSIIYLVGSKNQPIGGPSAAGNKLANAGAQVVGSGDVSKLSGRDVILGDQNAKVTLIEYGDYQCPFCGKFFSDTEPLLRADYIKTGKVRMVFRNFQFLGPESTASAEAAECAKDQSKFWAYHDALYAAEVKDGQENSGNLNRDLFLKLAADVKLDVPSFTACVDSGKYADQIQKDQDAASAVGVNSTPTVFVNGQEFRGALPYSQFKTVIDKLLAQ